MRTRRFLYALMAVFLPCLLLLVVGEVVGRAYSSKNSLYKYTSGSGWAPKENFRYSGSRADASGKVYEVTVSTNRNGFRQWGNTDSDKTRILFIGDSFTGDPFVSDRQAYFNQLELNDVEVFAGGAGGYGTLQELMLLQNHVSVIKPDIFVLQFCDNDFVNNNMALEGESIVRNQKNFRPYLDHNKIVFRLDDHHWYKILYRNVYLFRVMDILVQQLQFKIYGDYFPQGSSVDKKYLDQMLESEKTTSRLMAMMAGAVPEKTKLLTFTCATRNPEDTARWSRVSESAGFIPLPEVSRAVEEAEGKGRIVRAADGRHWSPEGHRLAGEELGRMIGGMIKRDEK